MEKIVCRKGCGACCIAPSLSSPIPGMPRGKPAGERCAQLSPDNLCRVFGLQERPPVCVAYQATREYCGTSRKEAIRLLQKLEAMTSGGPSGESVKSMV